ncbi:hypothetical protein DICVIV_13790 [Dictyocaulus viviparus]|uniref:Uncharacterized protein n=1 Tax=Dictyocaulus viviparus TaxID=29172 RepID=A0A0D8X6Y7_DICVI|nr:hypothetical protein DICVIV_13790 [Dictyocaulus viviparus]
MSAVNTAFYNIPLFSWGLSTTSAFSDMERFATTGLLSVNSYRCFRCYYVVATRNKLAYRVGMKYYILPCYSKVIIKF